MVWSHERVILRYVLPLTTFNGKDAKSSPTSPGTSLRVEFSDYDFILCYLLRKWLKGSLMVVVSWNDLTSETISCLL